MRSYTFLVNPAAGSGSGLAAAVQAAGVLRGAGAQVEVLHSPSVARGADLAREAVAAGSVVVAVGGDGMVAATTEPVVRAGGTMGILPAGRGNDFVRMLGLPTDPEQVAQRLLHGTERQVDLLEIDQPGRAPRVVAGSVYCGVDAQAAAMVNAMRRVPKAVQYQLAGVRSLIGYTPAEFEIEVDGTTHRFRAATAVVANSAYYGNGMRIAPDAAVDDGLFDLVVIEAASRWDLIRKMPTVYDGRHVDFDQVHVLRGSSVTIRGEHPAAGQKPARGVPAGADGEELADVPMAGEEPQRVSVLPGALTLLG